MCHVRVSIFMCAYAWLQGGAMSGSPAFDAKYVLEKIEIGSGATAVVLHT